MFSSVQVQLARNQKPEADIQIGEALAELEGAEGRFQAATHSLVEAASQLISAQQLLVANTMHALASIEQAYTQSRMSRLAGAGGGGRKVLEFDEEPAPSHGASVMAGEYLMLAMTSTAGNFI